MIKKLSLFDAVQEILAQPNINAYRLAKILGCTAGHIYHIKQGKVQSPNAKLAWGIWKHFNILVDTYNTPEQLEAIYGAEK